MREGLSHSPVLGQETWNTMCGSMKASHPPPVRKRDQRVAVGWTGEGYGQAVALRSPAEPKGSRVGHGEEGSPRATPAIGNTSDSALSVLAWVWSKDIHFVSAILGCSLVLSAYLPYSTSLPTSA